MAVNQGQKLNRLTFQEQRRIADWLENGFSKDGQTTMTDVQIANICGDRLGRAVTSGNVGGIRNRLGIYSSRRTKAGEKAATDDLAFRITRMEDFMEKYASGTWPAYLERHGDTASRDQ